jgi:hypothetical protein
MLLMGLVLLGCICERNSSHKAHDFLSFGR